MADISITAASVVKSTGVVIQPGFYAGETITAGMPVYLKASDGLIYKAINSAAASAAAVGVAAHAALAGQPIAYFSSGPYTAGGTLTIGNQYCVSATAGGLAPVADISTGMFSTGLGIATSTTVLLLNISISGVTHS